MDFLQVYEKKYHTAKRKTKNKTGERKNASICYWPPLKSLRPVSVKEITRYSTMTTREPITHNAFAIDLQFVLSLSVSLPLSCLALILIEMRTIVLVTLTCTNILDHLHFSHRTDDMARKNVISLSTQTFHTRTFEWEKQHPPIYFDTNKFEFLRIVYLPSADSTLNFFFFLHFRIMLSLEKHVKLTLKQFSLLLLSIKRFYKKNL